MHDDELAETAEYRYWLSSEGCELCGEENPDVLDAFDPALPGCPTVQASWGKKLVYCEACAPSGPVTFIDYARHRARVSNERESDRRVAAMLVYECGNVAYDRVTKAAAALGSVWPDERPEYVPTGPVECDCGAFIDRVVTRPFGGGSSE